ncbi:hypothetical protein M427DRAFT_138483 [Gonapodya prolifera JEL478]|uniref:BRCT domain-containing protein n=1 Tax=Gonapodya prolifera (strain JEL478) TaxID=1344416 RepID=A0A139A2Z5_GONPJ|nr:hypothetical protein M427DRAFT_138483 [Gonapodya prolifera JEL478]|eukprot:KXS11177.1 hypothetical protein M427DRAFT_138483 [Gonapodya prolifera JEL478]
MIFEGIRARFSPPLAHSRILELFEAQGGNVIAEDGEEGQPDVYFCDDAVNAQLPATTPFIHSTYISNCVRAQSLLSLAPYRILTPALSADVASLLAAHWDAEREFLEAAAEYESGVGVGASANGVGGGAAGRGRPVRAAPGPVQLPAAREATQKRAKRSASSVAGETRATKSSVAPETVRDAASRADVDEEMDEIGDRDEVEQNPLATTKPNPSKRPRIQRTPPSSRPDVAPPASNQPPTPTTRSKALTPAIPRQPARKSVPSTAPPVSSSSGPSPWPPSSSPPPPPPPPRSRSATRPIRPTRPTRPLPNVTNDGYEIIDPTELVRTASSRVLWETVERFDEAGVVVLKIEH